MPVIGPDVLVGDIVQFCPTTLKVFACHNVDLCCESGLSLNLAAQKHAVALDQLLRELNEAMEAQAAVKR